MAEGGENLDAPRIGRGIGVTICALGLAIGVLAALPVSRAKSQRHQVVAHHTTTPAPTSSVPSSASTSTSTTTTTRAGAAEGVHVAVLAAAGTPSGAVTGQLSAAGATLLHESPIPSSWVSTLPGPVVHYPAGLASAAAQVAHVLHIPSSQVSQEQPGTSYGASVVEVFLPAS